MKIIFTKKISLFVFFLVFVACKEENFLPRLKEDKSTPFLNDINAQIAEIESKKSQLELKNTELIDLERKKDSLEKQIKNLNTEFKKLQRDSTSERQRIENEISGLRNQLKSLEEDISTKTQEKDKIKSEINKIEEKISGYLEKLITLNKIDTSQSTYKGNSFDNLNTRQKVIIILEILKKPTFSEIKEKIKEAYESKKRKALKDREIVMLTTKLTEILELIKANKI